VNILSILVKRVMEDKRLRDEEEEGNVSKDEKHRLQPIKGEKDKPKGEEKPKGLRGVRNG